MQWRKLFDHNPLFLILNDKLAAREFIARRAPDLNLPRILWVGDGSTAIPSDVLQGDVVVKVNNASDRNYFIRGGQYDPEDLDRTVQRWRTEKAYGRKDGEWSYRLIKRRIFVEEMLTDPDGSVVDINIRAGRGKVAYGTLLLHSKTDRESAIYLTREEKTRRIFYAATAYRRQSLRPPPYQTGIRRRSPMPRASAKTSIMRASIFYGAAANSMAARSRYIRTLATVPWARWAWTRKPRS